MPRRRSSGANSVYRTQRIAPQPQPLGRPVTPRPHPVIPEWLWRDGLIALVIAAIVSASTIFVQYRIDEDRAARELRAANLNFVRDKSSGDGQELKPFNSFDLSGQNMSGLQLVGANFSDANLDGSSFSSSDLELAIFARTSARDATFDMSEMEFAILHQTDFSRAKFRNASLPRNMMHVRMLDVDLRRASLPADIDFSASDLRGVNLENKDLHNARFARNLTPSYGGSDLSGANLSGANLADVEFGVVVTDGLASQKVALISYFIDQVGVENVILDDPHRGNSEFYKNNVLVGETKLVDICYNSETIWPTNFTPPPNNPATCDKFEGSATN
ncbi:Uncharacterized protein YjbI, contains pentapeptide repeats [Rhodococcoides kroppenstedtii]|uniref:Uncharacterized protein YjbI, contains pentapeptide repeats n=2 Tax=Rhodococcoides kroppenstedtii TaxID=293050 RepID=A0A1I0T222_9NOCA|nr:Uncharacterized protein YjbI, contains pentapeptide repeats [Rhodococcus kroppenstedtii]